MTTAGGVSAGLEMPMGGCGAQVGVRMLHDNKLCGRRYGRLGWLWLAALQLKLETCPQHTVQQCTPRIGTRRVTLVTASRLKGCPRSCA